MKHNSIPKVRKAKPEDVAILQQFQVGLIQAELPMDETLKEDTTIYYDLDELIRSPESEIFVVELDD